MRAATAGLALILAFIAPLAAPAAQSRGDNARNNAPRGGDRPAALPRGAGFDLNNDIAAGKHPAPPANTTHRQPVTTSHSPGEIAVLRRYPVINPSHRGQAPWSWNRGVVWYTAPTYWGGGFWGPFPLDIISYVPVAPDSPGATLLINYQLTQTPCNQADLVVIYGPDESTICTYPNDLVAPGEYDLDPANMTLISRN